MVREQEIEMKQQLSNVRIQKNVLWLLTIWIQPKGQKIEFK
jgi:hypothetical protein